jgi:uncharacterized phage protein gp47/JayE
MPDYVRPTLAELDRRINADLAAMPAALREALSHTWARAAHGLHGHLDWIDRQCSPLTCELERLYDWAALYGIARLAASPAVGTVIATGSPGASIVADAALRGTNGLNYKVQAAVVMPQSGVVSVSVRSESTGEDANLPANAALKLIDPLPGIATAMTVGADSLTGGAAEETLDDWRLRVADEWEAMTVRGARGGRVEDYKFWCESAHPAVTGALVFPHALGLGTVVIHPICDGYADRLPTPAVLDAIGAYLKDIAPATADWRLALPIPKPVTVILHLDPAADTADARARISTAILAAILAEKSETSVLLMAELDAAIATVTNQYQRLAPTADIAVEAGEVLTLAEVAWS